MTSMTLSQLVSKYLIVSGGYGRPAALADFGLGRVWTEQIFSTLDEDYHISRYFHFTSAEGDAYKINGFDHTHVSIDAEIQSVL
jgi:hypothetical protein